MLEKTAEMCGRLSAGEIVKLAPGETTAFNAGPGITSAVVKLPSVKGNKFAA